MVSQRKTRAGRVHEVLAGIDGPGRRAAPWGEFLDIVPLLALAILIANDHWLKYADLLPSAITGKLSDITGLIFFPLLITATVDTGLWGLARLGVRADFTLRRYKLWIAITATAALFVAVKLSWQVNAEIVTLLDAIGFPSRIVMDPHDLWTLPALGVAYWQGIREITRVPLGRLEYLAIRWRAGQQALHTELADIAKLTGKTAEVTALARAVADYSDQPNETTTKRVSTALTWFRGSTEAPHAPRSLPPSD